MRDFSRDNFSAKHQVLNTKYLLHKRSIKAFQPFGKLKSPNTASRDLPWRQIWAVFAGVSRGPRHARFSRVGVTVWARRRNPERTLRGISGFWVASNLDDQGRQRIQRLSTSLYPRPLAAHTAADATSVRRFINVSRQPRLRKGLTPFYEQISDMNREDSNWQLAIGT